jgi:predicted Zn-dependent protease
MNPFWFFLLGFLVAACARLPLETEKVIGKPQSMFVDAAFDAREHAKLDEIGTRIFHASDLTREIYQFKLVYSREINAMAMAGGYIYVFLGLTEIVQTEDELAAVLAHEVAHVTQRHLAQRFDWKLPFILVGESVPLITSGLVPNLVERAFSRQDEFEADMKGLGYLARAGYCPKGMEVIMEKFVEMYGLSHYIAYFQTHPPSQERLAKIREALNSSKMMGCVSTPLDTKIFLRFTLK